MEAKNHCSFFMMPFVFNNEWKPLSEKILSPTSVWEESEITVEEDVLYPYVQNLLQATANEWNRKKNHNENLSNYQIYSLKTRDKSDKAGCLAKFLDRTSTYEASGLEFKIQNRVDDLFSIKLIICPIAKIGLLLVPQSIVIAKATVSDIMDFNYNLKKTKTDTQVPSFKINPVVKDLKRIEELQAKGEIEEKVKNVLKGSVGKLKDNLNDMYSLLGLPAITERELLKQYVGFHEWIGCPKKIEKSKNGNDDGVVYKYEVYNEDEFKKNIVRLNKLAAFLDCEQM